MTEASLKKHCESVATTLLDISYRAHTGHIGSSLSISDLLGVLYIDRLRMKGVKDPKRDRFILSKGHAAAALYSVLYYKGILTKRELESFGMDAGGLCEHPEITTPGIEMTSGSLGHGMAFGAGIAWGLKKLYKKPPHVFVLISDGECGEGSVWEAALFASRMRLINLTVILDYNKWQCFGTTDEVVHLEPVLAKWQSFGFGVREIDGHNLMEISRAYASVPIQTDKPSIIVANTISGHGISSIENQLVGHYKVFTEEEFLIAKKELRGVYTV
jgi:transketolase